jgi:integrase
LPNISRAIAAGTAAGEVIPRWFPYQLRHAGVTYYAQPANGGSFDLAQAIAGHSSGTITDRYNHSRKAIIRDYARRLESPKEEPETNQLTEIQKENAELKATLKMLLQELKGQAL